jgi:hypothetical protein
MAMMNRIAEYRPMLNPAMSSAYGYDKQCQDTFIMEPNWRHLKYVLTRNCTLAWNERAGVTALAAPVDDLTGELQTGEIIFNEQLESKRLVSEEP